MINFKIQYTLYKVVLACGLIIFLSCNPKIVKTPTVESTENPGFIWENSTIYFLLTDRFYNGNPKNDFQHQKTPAPLRGYEGGDVLGITQKIEEGYFTKLGIDVLWMTPLVENIAGYVDEGTGNSYGFHGYWIKDWTAVDKRLGTKEEVRDMVKLAHAKGIKVIMDVIINHTGPVTSLDTQWPDDWVRTSPRCTYKDYKTTVECTLVANLPDILTESQKEVDIPIHLQNKWKSEGRFEEEMASLDAFFKRTGYLRLPHFYLIKWITDLILEYGIDGFRVDTVKHVEEDVWTELKKQANLVFEKAKLKYPAEIKEEERFYMLGEVYNYNASHGNNFDFGDRKVDYFAHGFDALINFGFVWDAKLPYDELFQKYADIKSKSLPNVDFVHYVSSHDDGNPFDKHRTKILESGTKLLLSPGIAQIYYGDEIGRPLIANALGDAQLRTPMDWKSLEENDKMICLDHWQKLGQFRKNNPAVGAGNHTEINKNVFARVFKKGKVENKVVFGIDLIRGEKTIPVKGYFNDGEVLYDYYSRAETKVKDGQVVINNPFQMVLLAKK
ncbi:MAG: alpha-amylase family glycosyl hydrolase [Saprospiraceae bacterium]